jgi:hypothetical protein
MNLSPNYSIPALRFIFPYRREPFRNCKSCDFIQRPTLSLHCIAEHTTKPPVSCPCFGRYRIPNFLLRHADTAVGTSQDGARASRPLIKVSQSCTEPVYQWTVAVSLSGCESCVRGRKACISSGTSAWHSVSTFFSLLIRAAALPTSFWSNSKSTKLHRRAQNPGASIIWFSPLWPSTFVDSRTKILLPTTMASITAMPRPHQAPTSKIPPWTSSNSSLSPL